MKEIFIIEKSNRKEKLWVLYTKLESQIVPRVGEYIHINQKDKPRDVFIVKWIYYENFSYGGEYNPRAMVYVEPVEGDPPFSRSSCQKVSE